MRSDAACACLLAIVLLAACSAEPTQNQYVLRAGTGLTTDASLRVSTALEPSSDSPHGRVRPTLLNCTEPSPDVASSLVNALSLAVKADAAKGPLALGVGVGSSFTSSQQIAQLAERTVAVQLLRESMWRACEAYANGGINEINYSLLLARIPETMATLRYAELAGGDFGRSLATLTTSGETTSSAQGSAGGSRLDELARQAATKLEESEKATRDAQRDLERSVTEKQNLEEKVQQDREQIDKQSSELATATPATAPAIERQLNSTRSQERADSTKLAEKTNEVAERQRKLDETRSENRKRQEEAKVAQQLATSAKASGTAQAAGAISNSGVKDVVSALKDMHRDFLRDDFSSDSLITACLIALSNPDAYRELAKECNGQGALYFMTNGILDRRQAYISKVSDHLHQEKLEFTRATMLKDDAKRTRANACKAALDKAKSDADTKDALALCKTLALD